MPLKLSLKPGETFIVNGAVVRNGDRRGVLLLENQARVLREKDIMRAEEATTPASRTYFAVMQMYLTGTSEGRVYDQFARAVAELMGTNPSEETRAMALEVSELVSAGNHYKALTRCRKIIAAVDQAAGKAA